MTIKEAWKIYNLQTEKINKTKKNIKMILEMMDGRTFSIDPLQRVVLDKNEASEIIEELMDYVKHLEAALEERLVLPQ